MKFLVLALPFFALLGGCGKPVEETGSAEHIFPSTYSNEPRVLIRQNESCAQSFFRTDDIRFDLHLFLMGRPASVSKPVGSLLTGLSLKDGEIIAGSYYGEEAEFIASKYEYRFVQKSPPQELTICPDETDFDRGSVESAGLNAAFFINKAGKTFRDLFPDIKVEPITLSVGPLYTVPVTKRTFSGVTYSEKAYMTDNAFYLPKEKSIVLLPHGLSTKRRGHEQNLWEIPMVPTHEYGHHLFQALFKGPLPAASCFPSQLEEGDVPHEESRIVTRELVIGGINEGFADLVAYYTLSSTERDIDGVKCLEVNRDVGSPTFYNGTPKVFSRSFLESFFSGTVEKSALRCEEQNNQDIHVLGAVFAHNADLFLSDFTSSKEEKLKVLVKWVKLLGALKDINYVSNPETYLRDGLSSFARVTLAHFKLDFNKKICGRLKRSYPELDLRECSAKP